MRDRAEQRSFDRNGQGFGNPGAGVSEREGEGLVSRPRRPGGGLKEPPAFIGSEILAAAGVDEFGCTAAGECAERRLETGGSARCGPQGEVADPDGACAEIRMLFRRAESTWMRRGKRRWKGKKRFADVAPQWSWRCMALGGSFSMWRLRVCRPRGGMGMKTACLRLSLEERVSWLRRRSWRTEQSGCQISMSFGSGSRIST